MADTSNTDPDQSPAPQTDAVKEDKPMEIHKPKPVHNWREFLSEIAVVVIGVLIALSLEQAVEDWRQHQQYLANREGVRSELSYVISNLMRRKEMAPCIERRLNEVSIILDSAEAHQPFTPPNWIGSPNSFVIRTSTESDLSRSDLFPAAEQEILGPMYSWLESVKQFQDEERLAWSHLQPMESRAILSPEMIADMRAAVGEARMENDRLRFTLNWLHLFAVRYGLSETATNEWISLRPKVWPICMPMTTPREEGQRMMFDYQETYK